MNRRMPNGMYGGVRGEKKISPTRLYMADNISIECIVEEYEVLG